MELAIVKRSNTGMNMLMWTASGIEPDQSPWICKLIWFYTDASPFFMTLIVRVLNVAKCVIRAIILIYTFWSNHLFYVV